MKKLFMILLCVLMLTAVTTTIAFAEGEAPEENLTISEQVVNYVTGHAEQILTMAAAIASTVIVKLITGKLSSSVGTLNNNAITIAKDAGDKLSAASEKLEEYTEKMTEVLSKFAKSEDEKKSLEEMLCKVTTLLETSKIALVELGNEFAELLLFANIPTTKKESFYASHKEAMRKLEEAEGVINND